MKLLAAIAILLLAAAVLRSQRDYPEPDALSEPWFA